MKKKNAILITSVILILMFSLQMCFAKLVYDQAGNVIGGGIISQEIITSLENGGSNNNTVDISNILGNYEEVVTQLEGKLSLWNDGKLISNKSHMKMTGGKLLTIGYEPKENFEKIIYDTIAVRDDSGAMIKTFFDTVEQNVKNSKGEYKKLYVTLPNVTGRVKIEMVGILANGSKTELKEYTFDLIKEEVTNKEAILDIYYGNTKMKNGSTYEVTENPTFELKIDDVEEWDSITYSKTFLNSDGTVADLQTSAIYLLVDNGEAMQGFTNNKVKIELAKGGSIRISFSGQKKDGSTTQQKFNLTANKENLKADISLWDNGTLIKNNSKMAIEAGKTLTVNCSPKENVKTITCKFAAVPDDNGVMIKTYFPPIELDVNSEKKFEIKVPDVVARLKLYIDATLVDGTKATTKEYTFDVVKKVNEVTKGIFEVYYNGNKMENGKTYEVSVDPTFELKCIPEESFNSITYNKVFLNSDGTMANVQQNTIYMINPEDGFDKVKVDLQGSIKWNIGANLKDGTRIGYSFILKAQKEDLEANISLWDNGTIIKNNSKMEIEAGKTLTVNCSPKENFKTIVYRFYALPGDDGTMIKTAFMPVEQDVQATKKLEVTIPDVEARLKLTIEATLIDGTKTATKEYTFDVVKQTEEVTKEIFEVYYNGNKMENGKTYEVSVDPTFELKCTPEENFEEITYNRVFLNENGTMANIQENAIYMVDIKDGFNGAKIKINLNGLIKWNINAKLKNGTVITNSYTLTAKKDSLEANISLWDNGNLIKNNSHMDMNSGKTLTVNCSPKENFKTIKYTFTPVPDDNGVMIKTYFRPIEQNVKNAKKLEVTLPDVEARIKLNIEATLIDGTKAGIKEYTFDLKKKIPEILEMPWENISSWAEEELNEAFENHLIPEILNEKDYTEGVSRSEFAAIAIKVYEKIAGKEADLPSYNPFKDTSDTEVLKAYYLGITNGVSDTEFAPDRLITREQMATMMTRVLEKTEVNVSVNTENKFVDDVEISEWAREGVYFMNEKGIIKGMENNVFKAKNTATREQALLIANRCMENL